MYVIAK